MVLVAPGQRVRYNSWRAYQQSLSHRQPESYIREIIFWAAASRSLLRNYKGDTKILEKIRFIMTNLPGNIQLVIGQL